MPIRKGKKNKRGAKGSTEEENSASKHPNMATDNAHSEEHDEEVEEVDTVNDPTCMISNFTHSYTKNHRKSNSRTKLAKLANWSRRLGDLKAVQAAKTVLSDVSTPTRNWELNLMQLNETFLCKEMK